MIPRSKPKPKLKLKHNTITKHTTHSHRPQTRSLTTPHRKLVIKSLSTPKRQYTTFFSNDVKNNNLYSFPNETTNNVPQLQGIEDFYGPCLPSPELTQIHNQWSQISSYILSENATQPPKGLQYTFPLPLIRHSTSNFYKLLSYAPRLNCSLPPHQLHRNLREWIQTNGGILHPHIISRPCDYNEENYGMWGIFATEDIPAYTTIGIIPRGLTINSFNPFYNRLTDEYIMTPNIPSDLFELDIHDEERIKHHTAIRILLELANYQHSPFKPYLDTLPKSFNILPPSIDYNSSDFLSEMTFDQRITFQILSDMTFGELDDIHDSLLYDIKYSQIKKMNPQLQLSYNVMHRSRIFETSRAFSSLHRYQHIPSPLTPLLVPFFDLANHSNAPNITTIELPFISPHSSHIQSSPLSNTTPEFNPTPIINLNRLDLTKFTPKDDFTDLGEYFITLRDIPKGGELFLSYFPPPTDHDFPSLGPLTHQNAVKLAKSAPLRPIPTLSINTNINQSRIKEEMNEKGQIELKKEIVTVDYKNIDIYSPEAREHLEALFLQLPPTNPLSTHSINTLLKSSIIRYPFIEAEHFYPYTTTSPHIPLRYQYGMVRYGDHLPYRLTESAASFFSTMNDSVHHDRPLNYYDKSLDGEDERVINDYYHIKPWFFADFNILDQIMQKSAVLYAESLKNTGLNGILQDGFYWKELRRLKSLSLRRQYLIDIDDIYGGAEQTLHPFTPLPFYPSIEDWDGENVNFMLEMLREVKLARHVAMDFDSKYRPEQPVEPIDVEENVEKLHVQQQLEQQKEQKKPKNQNDDITTDDYDDYNTDTDDTDQESSPLRFIDPLLIQFERNDDFLHEQLHDEFVQGIKKRAGEKGELRLKRFELRQKQEEERLGDEGIDIPVAYKGKLMRKLYNEPNYSIANIYQSTYDNEYNNNDDVDEYNNNNDNDKNKDITKQDHIPTISFIQHLKSQIKDIFMGSLNPFTKSKSTLLLSQQPKAILNQNKLDRFEPQFHPTDWLSTVHQLCPFSFSLIHISPQLEAMAYYLAACAIRLDEIHPHAMLITRHRFFSLLYKPTQKNLTQFITEQQPGQQLDYWLHENGMKQSNDTTKMRQTNEESLSSKCIDPFSLLHLPARCIMLGIMETLLTIQNPNITSTTNSTISPTKYQQFINDNNNDIQPFLKENNIFTMNNNNNNTNPFELNQDQLNIELQSQLQSLLITTNVSNYAIQHIFNSIATQVGVQNRFWDLDMLINVPKYPIDREPTQDELRNGIKRVDIENFPSPNGPVSAIGWWVDIIEHSKYNHQYRLQQQKQKDQQFDSDNDINDKYHTNQQTRNQPFQPK